MACFLTQRLERLQTVQRRMARKVIVEDKFHKPLKWIAGIDSAFKNEIAITACVVSSVSPMRIIEEETTITKIKFPYVPTFLSVREGPAIINTIKLLKKRPDILIINAHGIAHPLYCGCASYVGVLTGNATIGVAASNLCGEYNYEPKEVGDAVVTYCKGRQVGWVFKSKRHCKSIFISPGHNVGLESCLTIVKRCVVNHKFPEPLWLAHRLANTEKKKAFS